jgi:hypothetical protein
MRGGDIHEAVISKSLIYQALSDCRVACRNLQELFGLTTSELDWLQSGVLTGANPKIKATRRRRRHE